MSIFGRYYGSKKRHIKKYPKPPEGIKTIIEPFLGGGCYLLEHNDYDLIGIEKDIVCCKAVKYIQENGYESLLKHPYNHKDDVREYTTDEGELSFLKIISSVGASKTNKISVFCKNQNTIKLLERQQQILDKVKKINLIEGDCFDYFDELDGKDVLWFIDPPYSGSCGREYKENKINFEKLANKIKQLKGSVIVCGKSDETWMDFKPLYKVTSITGYKYYEAIWTNF